MGPLEALVIVVAVCALIVVPAIVRRRRLSRPPSTARGRLANTMRKAADLVDGSDGGKGEPR